MSLRVTLFTDADVWAGTERHILELARALRELGVEACLACPAPSPLAERAAEAAIPVTVIGKIGLIDNAAIRAVRRLVADGETQIIHAHNGRTALLSALALRGAGSGRLVVTQHFLAPSHTGRTGLTGVIWRASHHWLNGRIDHLIAVSDAVLQSALERGEARAAKATVIANGITDPGASSPEKSTAIRNELGIPADAPLIVCLARLEREKDVGTLVSAMAVVAAVNSAARCVIAGDGSQRPGLAEQITRLGLEKIVHLAGFRADAMSLVGAADLLALPSLAEPFGLVLLEAMALAKPVVATRVGGPAQIVDEPRTGLLVPPGDPRALAAAILDVLADPVAARNMGDQGRRRYEQLFSARRMAQDTLAVYDKVLAKPRRRLGAKAQP
jgi:glycosyltransferase involved in cell wall biosynthesis